MSEHAIGWLALFALVVMAAAFAYEWAIRR
jgi:hypothetical protein